MNKNQIYGSIISSGKRNNKSVYNRLRISRNCLREFRKNKRIIITHGNDCFEVDISRKLFCKYGEIDNSKLEKWFGNKYVKVSLVPIDGKSRWKIEKLKF